MDLFSRHLKNDQIRYQSWLLLPDGFFRSKKILKNVDWSYKMDLDLWDCFRREKPSSYNQRNMVMVIWAETLPWDATQSDTNVTISF